MVCFPQSDTNPQKAGSLETLTQRYWEAMLSGCIIVGRAPQELIDFIGYNSVVEVEWDNPEMQLSNILHDIDSYQKIVDKSLESARKHASWDCRMPTIKECLSK